MTSSKHKTCLAVEDQFAFPEALSTDLHAMGKDMISIDDALAHMGTCVKKGEFAEVWAAIHSS